MLSCSTRADFKSGVFDRPLHLAAILDQAADELARTWFGYEWNDRTRCNCGVVARQVMEVNTAGLKKLLPPVYENGVFHATWRSMTENYCPESGLSKNEVFVSLQSVGLKNNDFVHLEELSDPDILRGMGSLRRSTRPVSRSRKSDVIAYLRTWAKGIESFQDEARLVHDGQ